MDWKLELVVIPISDVVHVEANLLGVEGLGAAHDHRVSEGVRVVQLTSPGSACSNAFGEGIVNMQPGSLQGLQLVVSDLHAARAQLIERGAEVSEVQVFDSGSFRPSRGGDALDNVGFVFFSDPDGNGWAVQQIPAHD